VRRVALHVFEVEVVLATLRHHLQVGEQVQKLGEFVLKTQKKTINKLPFVNVIERLRTLSKTSTHKRNKINRDSTFICQSTSNICLKILSGCSKVVEEVKKRATSVTGTHQQQHKKYITNLGKLQLQVVHRRATRDKRKFSRFD
jgi:hypothetical protein